MQPSMWQSGQQTFGTDWDEQLRRVVPPALHRSGLRRAAAQLRHHTSISLLPPLAVFVPLALFGRYTNIPDSLAFIFNFVASVLLARLFLVSSEVIVANLRLSPSGRLIHFVHGTINTILSCFSPMVIGLACIIQNETRLAEVFIAGCLTSNMLLGTGAVLLVGGALNMRDADGHGTTHLYPSVNGQLWSLQTILASVTALVVHEITGPGDEHAALGRLISRGAASLMLLIHIMWLYFRYGSHRNLFDHDTTDENTIDEMRHREIRTSSQQLSQGVLSWRSLHLLSWLFVLVCPVLGTATAMNLVTTTEGLAQTVHLSKNAVTLTLLPLVGIVPTMVETLKAAAKNHMDLAARLTLESSVDITYVALPTLILVAWVNDKPMSMNFGYFEVIELCVSAWLIGRIFSSGRSTYLDGATLLSLYFIMSLANSTLF